MADDLDPRTTYLTRVATGLRLSDSLDREVVEELAGHIEDSVHALEGEGLDPSMARREALARLGDPDELASGLRRAHQTRRRLLAAAGYGVVAALYGAFWAYLFAAALTVFATVCAAALITVILRAADISASFWETITLLFAIPTLWFTSGYAGRRVSDVVSTRSFRDRARVAPAVALIGGGSIAIVTIFCWRTTLEPVLVAALLGTPVMFAIGALVPAQGTSSGRIRSSASRIFLALAIGTAALVAIGLLTLQVDVHAYEQDFSALGPTWPGSIDLSTSGDVVASSPDAPRVLTIDPPPAVAGLRDLRLEAWPLTAEWGQVAPTATAPVATGSLDQVAPGTYQGVIALEPLHQTTWYEISTTGVGPDGTRYVLTYDGPVASPPWVGTVWEWLTGR